MILLYFSFMLKQLVTVQQKFSIKKENTTKALEIKTWLKIIFMH